MNGCRHNQRLVRRLGKVAYLAASGILVVNAPVACRPAGNSPWSASVLAQGTGL